MKNLMRDNAKTTIISHEVTQHYLNPLALFLYDLQIMHDTTSFAVQTDCMKSPLRHIQFS